MKLFQHFIKKHNGFTLLEVIVVVVIISILFALALNHLLKWRIKAEQASFNKLTSEMRSALKLEIASHYAKGRLQNVLTLVGTNPLNYAIETPASYIGEQNKPSLNEINPGEWVFDTTNKILIYRVRYPEHFTTKLDGIKRIELKITLLYADIDKNRRFTKSIDTIEGLRLSSTQNYTWNIQN